MHPQVVTFESAHFEVHVYVTRGSGDTHAEHKFPVFFNCRPDIHEILKAEKGRFGVEGTMVLACGPASLCETSRFAAFKHEVQYSSMTFEL